MTLERALEITGIRADELSRIDVVLVDSIIKSTEKDIAIFDPYGHKKELVEAYRRIKERH